MSLKTLWRDDFDGPSLGAAWVGGHLNSSTEVQLAVSNGLRFSFVEGSEYASAGIVTRGAIFGDFEAEVQFEITDPCQGATFELAAILVSPPDSTGLPSTQFSDAHRVFNVHGSPPYVSSELDENDGWRMGWNWGTRQGARNSKGDWVADNTENRYGGPKFGPLSGVTNGWLQLTRKSGSHWKASGRMLETDPWKVCGEQQTDLLSGPVYLRLVAKHWVKRRIGLRVAPASHIVFSRFTLSA